MADITYARPTVWFEPSRVVLKVVNTVIGLIEFMLVLRLVLVLLGASAGAPFVAWVYSVTGSLIAPFSGAFPPILLGGYVLELSTIFAMIGYAIIGWLVLRVLSLLTSSLDSTSL